jgi:catechol 2,3-dioxygenase-like lactoylglutathione lyase family enzyme
MITPQKLNAAGIVVRDLDRSLAWYKEKFGFEFLFDVPNGVIIGANGVELWVAQAKDPDTARQSDHDQDICIRLIGFEVSEDDFSKVRADFSDVEVVDIDHPKFKSCIIEDPDGHAIELFVDKRDCRTRR